MATKKKAKARKPRPMNAFGFKFLVDDHPEFPAVRIRDNEAPLIFIDGTEIRKARRLAKWLRAFADWADAKGKVVTKVQKEGEG